MSTGPADRLPIVRWALLTFLLLAELGVLSVLYDAADRGSDPGWAGTVVAWTPAVFRWALVAGGLAVVLGLWLLRDELLAAFRTPYPPARLALVRRREPARVWIVRPRYSLGDGQGRTRWSHGN